MSEIPDVPQGACDRCGKEPATVHIRKVVAGEETSIHVCVSCAKDLGAEPGGANLAHDPLSILFKGMEGAADTGAICPGCGMTFDRFRETGRLGCADCYTTFRSELTPLLRRIHGGIQHRGKSPLPEDQLGGIEAAVRRLTEELDRAVVTEDYEKAARLRDRLRAIRAGEPGGGDA